MPRYKLTIEYDGTHYSGWQIQPEAVTVEQTLEDAFSKILQQKIDLIGQGRTDAGVHALGQTAHIDLPEEVHMQKLIYGVNGIIGSDIHITCFEEVPDDFHARFDATAREYEYCITTRTMPLKHRYCWEVRNKLDTSLLIKCADMLKGEYDFAGFSKFNEDNYTTICEIQKSEFRIEGEVIKYRIRANRFLRNMVRRLTGTMINVGGGKLPIDDFQKLLINPEVNIPSYTAPAKGLVLQKIFYKS